ncbi:MAG TPA: hypothetical protein VHA73_00670 [Acidimicrobiales bacterium]|nr:hypothetical protein [Acidimicrobiales bacterium]
MVDVLGAESTHEHGTSAGDPAAGGGYHLEILLLSLASLLIEIGYTRLVSFKLFYYYVYLVIGLALLGIGSGAVVVSLSGRLRRASTDTILKWGSFIGGVIVAVGYLVVAFVKVDTFAMWRYGTGASFTNIARLLLVCFAVFVTFVPVGVMVATLFGRRTRGIGALYFADLLGAGVGCALAVPLVDHLGAPSVVLLAGLVLVVAGLQLAVRRVSKRSIPVGVVLAGLLLVPVVAPSVIPDLRPDAIKEFALHVDYRKWNSIFRIDAAEITPPGEVTRILLYHDGMIGSAIYQYDDNPASLGRYDRDPRSFPFAAMGKAPDRVLIIGAAGGNEVLTSLYYKVPHIEAVELNPVTYSLVKGRYASFDGHLAEQPGVKYVNADGRSYLARSHHQFDLVWYPAPDSYAATNASTSGAFVLSESYLYTEQAIVESLRHTTPDGIVAAQFGEVNYDNKPNRTSRYVTTARAALAHEGIHDPDRHIAVVVSPTALGATKVSTILVGKKPFTAAAIRRLVAQVPRVPDSQIAYAPGAAYRPSIVSRLATAPAADLKKVEDGYAYDVAAVTDNHPYFWHFSRFTDVIKHFGSPLDRQDPENATGERVLLLLLAVSVVFAAVFLLLPFLVVRRRWRELPRKGRSALYFSALGLGFMFFEISLIQRLTLFLGYPTYSLTVTLASLLTFTGVGALLSNRLTERPRRSFPVLYGALVALTAAYLFGLPALTSAMQDAALALRVIVTVAVLAPLGVVLGCFMPFGLRAVAGMTEHGREYVAWGWAVNGFASVVGSVLTTILAMTFGLNAVLVLAVIVYAVALAALGALGWGDRAVRGS